MHYDKTQYIQSKIKKKKIPLSTIITDNTAHFKDKLILLH